jgi:hypothetical protein
MRKLNSKPPRMLRLSRRNPPRRASLQGQPLAMTPSVASRQGQPRFRRLSRRNPSRRASPSPSLGSSCAGLAVVARGMRDLSPYESGLAARPSAGQPPPPWCLSACSGAPRCRRLRGTRQSASAPTDTLAFSNGDATGPRRHLLGEHRHREELHGDCVPAVRLATQGTPRPDTPTRRFGMLSSPRPASCMRSLP